MISETAIYSNVFYGELSIATILNTLRYTTVLTITVFHFISILTHTLKMRFYLGTFFPSRLEFPKVSNLFCSPASTFRFFFVLLFHMIFLHKKIPSSSCKYTYMYTFHTPNTWKCIYL